MKKVIWLSRHDLSAAQVKALRELHGEDAEIVKESPSLNGPEGLLDFIEKTDKAGYGNTFVYAVAAAVHYISATIRGKPFGIFENHPQKRMDGSFGLAAVYWVNVNRNYPCTDERMPAGHDSLRKVWVNPDPMTDFGETLIPVVRDANI
ncbi:hypothetical protein A3B18_03800 [Candidatus Giovannonibacteria bacterium RIFCSPLOWO2_01_FULL_46_13]|uniref:Uncharacterized protein n=1 Tax=Candidatus Giovannonibacteria bacterium RIFCSPLOWO2_01_FULL_46_13 TaxID=1798352 RepID=A0A1F5X3G3_9BACT|nr:MAG: hypothetical protein A3B18_03800 [Candidatus Giovannonibacteria bacterium RIFCSPLOWO2_01_FULL_46_13]